MTTQTPDAVRKLHVALLDCPHCGSRPERRTRRKQKVVRCHAGSHLLEAIADSQREADDIWNAMATDWARKNTREGQAATSIQVLNAIANIQHIAGVVVNGSLNTHAHQLRECARILSAALDGRAGDAGEGWKLAPVEPTEDMSDAGSRALGGNATQYRDPNGVWSAMLAATPAPAVDAVPAGEVERLASEAAAKALYDSWSDQPGWVPWVERGNSAMQERARREVML